MPHSRTNQKNTSLAGTLAGGILKARFPIIILFAIVTAFLSYTATTFKIDASAETLLVKNNPLFIRSQLADQTFAPEEFILLAYKPNSGDVFSQKSIAQVENLSNKISELERVKSVVSYLNVPLTDEETSLLFGDDIADLTWQKQQFSSSRMHSLLDDHPIYTDLLINQEKTAVAIQIVFERNEKLDELRSAQLAIKKKSLDRALSEQEETQLELLKQQAEPIEANLQTQREREIETINRIAQSVSADANVYLGGSYVVGYHLIDIIKNDLVVFGSAIAVVIAILLLIIYRSFRWVVLPLCLCGLSVLLTIGLFGLLELNATVISANFIALQIILTLAVIVHLIGSYRQATREEAQADDPTFFMLKHKLAPCFYATLTTSVGFGSLMLSGIQPVVSFGMMMMIAMIVTMTVSLLLFPSLLTFFKTRQKQPQNSIIDRALAGTQHVVTQWPILLIVVTLVATAGLGLGISRLNVENSFIHYFKPGTEVSRELTFIDQEFGGSTPLDVIIDVPQTEQSDDLLVTANTINQLHLAHEALNAFEATGSVTSLVSFTQLAKEVNGGKPLTEYELNSVYSLIDKDVANKLIGGYISESGDKLRIAMRIQDTTEGLDRARFIEQIRADLDTVGLAPDAFSLTSLFVLYQDILSRLVDSQIQTLGFVYIVLALVLLLIFRSVRIALISLIPNAITTLGILGAIGWLGIPLDLMTMTIAAIAMGIATDDTIHFVHSFQSGNTRGKGIQTAFTEAGKPIIITSVVIAIGFSMFAFSDFLPSVYFGAMTAVAMLLALVSDITILPALLHKFAAKADAEPEGSTS
ncbi:efflux RND transporter permease subunit [Alteromonas oceanisediminis]|uniref:efflux RND transporter permease subunit n=1 Tax=Alteromonas oceanisediminis TaxID=2836180 RepID=UPI001BDB50C8|nr:efflux RND transporter permease subunit [Alteromonas oceanisediminis]MBT0586690.1 MMPL family transporter [Alteromonas oceanisediminis]